jgi:hypothetical protein
MVLREGNGPVESPFPLSSRNFSCGRGFFRCAYTLEVTMKRFLIVGAVSAFAVTSVVAQTASEYYVVRDASTKKCTVVDKKPATTTTTVVDNGTFKTKTEAETGMKTMKVCTEK